MNREQAEQIAAKHFGEALPHYIADWVVPAIMEAVAVEREECAKVCDSVDNYANPMTAKDCADAIRARGEQ